MLFFIILCLLLLIILESLKLYEKVPVGRTDGAIIEARYGISTYMAASLNLSISGPGENISMMLVHSVPYEGYPSGLPVASTATTIPTSTLPIAGVNSIIPVIVPSYAEYYALFGGLRPYTTYDLTLKGVEGPWCRPGMPCAYTDVLRLVNESMRITTGANGTVSIANFT